MLKNARLVVAKVKYDKLDGVELGQYNTGRKSSVEKGIKELANKLGIMNVDLENSYIDFLFQFTNKNLGKNLHHQIDYGGTYQDYVKALSCFAEIVENAIPIETHPDKGKGTPKEEIGLKQVYVLVSAFTDGKNTYPVQLEVKENEHRGNKLYLTVMMTTINPEVLENGLAAKDGSVRSLFSGSDINLRSLMENVNSNDYNFLKYVPDGFLNAVQYAAKKKALEKDKEKYGKTKSSLSKADVTQTNTAAFKRWFGDSVVVNEDGSPKVMCHGTSEKNGEFYVFDQSKVKNKEGHGFKALGKGNYFTSKKANWSRTLPCFPPKVYPAV